MTNLSRAVSGLLAYSLYDFASSIAALTRRLCGFACCLVENLSRPMAFGANIFSRARRAGFWIVIRRMVTKRIFPLHSRFSPGALLFKTLKA